MDSATARTMIERATAWNQVPTLTSDEVDRLLVLAHAEREWRPSVYYQPGAFVFDDTTGMRFKAISGGYAGTETPTWPTVPAQTADDGEVAWEWADEATYDIYGAAAIGWEWKAARTAGKFDFGRGDSNWTRSQMYDHCIKMAAYYRGLGSGAADLNAGMATSGGARVGTITMAAPQQRVGYRHGGLYAGPRR